MDFVTNSQFIKHSILVPSFIALTKEDLLASKKMSQI